MSLVLLKWVHIKAILICLGPHRKEELRGDDLDLYHQTSRKNHFKNTQVDIFYDQKTLLRTYYAQTFTSTDKRWKWYWEICYIDNKSFLERKIISTKNIVKALHSFYNFIGSSFIKQSWENNNNKKKKQGSYNKILKK